MKHLSVTTQNKSGNSPIHKENIGYAVIAIGQLDDFISVDDFEGAGLTYKQREEPQVRIVQNGVELFVGTQHELFNLLSNK